MEEVIKRLHVSIPAGLFDVIYQHRDMSRIDSLVTELLCNYYGVDSNGTKKNRKQY